MAKAIVNRKVIKNGRIFIDDRHLFTKGDYEYMASREGKFVLVGDYETGEYYGMFDDLAAVIEYYGEEILCSAHEEQDYETLILRI